MKFRKSLSFIFIAAQALFTNAEKVTFKVLAVNGTPYVTIDGRRFDMSLDEYPLYKVDIDVNQFPVNYSYGIVNDNGTSEDENFVRQRSQNEPSLNEFINRSITVLEHPTLPRAYEAFPYYKPSKLFDDTHVATIVINCDPNVLQAMYQDPENKELKADATVVYASPYSVKTFNNAVFSISGQSTRGVPKLSYKIKNLKTEESKELFNRTSIKLRAEHMDPSFLRDKIYGDLLNSLGVPAAQNKFARVFINGEPVGLFDVSDDIANNRYLRETFNNGEKYAQVNPIFKADYCPTCEIGSVYGDLGYYGEDVTDPMYAVYTYKGSDESLDGQTQVANEIIPLVREINAYGKEASEMSFDIDTFLKYMAMEFLGGAIDNYWNKPGNYFLFKDLSKGKWYFHDADFHFSFGVGGQPELMLNTPLAQYSPGFDDVTPIRPPLEAILSREENNKKFKEIFDRLLKTSFHTEALYPRIESLVDLIREDAEWDFSLPRVNQSPEQHDTELVYTFDDFMEHVTSEADNSKYGTKPLRNFITNKINLVANELGIEVPATSDRSQGTVENPAQNASKESKNKSTKNSESRDVSGAVSFTTWNVFGTLCLVFLSLFFTL